MALIASYPTRTGHAVEVSRNSIGSYTDHCTGCNSRSSSDDIPAAEAEAAMCRWAAYHAEHCERLSFSAFTPTLTDMSVAHYGLLIAALDPEYADGLLIAVGANLTARRALAAFHAYTRTECDDFSRQELVDALRDGSLTVHLTPTRFLRNRHGWTAAPIPGADLAAWLIAPGLLP